MSLWQLEGFLECFDRWVSEDDPPPEWQLAVLEWIDGLSTSPMIDAVAAPGIGHPAWMAEIVDAGDNFVATVAVYVVDRKAMTARCSSITTLRRPI